jgi:hypothetical protein
MRPFAPTASVVVIATVVISAMAAAAAFAQQLPPLKPPPPAPIKPYQAVAVTAPPVENDPAFVAFRKQLGDAAAKKDRAALAHLVAAQNFFWMQDRDRADKSKSGVDNLAKAIGLDAPDGSGWELLNEYATEATAAELPEQKGVLCAPAPPGIDAKAFQALIGSTGTDPSEWGYPINGGLDVHADPQPASPVIEKLGMVLVRVLPDQQQNPGGPALLHIATPSGKSGYIDAQQLSPLGSDEICYAKDGGGWKIVGYIGGAPQ